MKFFNLVRVAIPTTGQGTVTFGVAVSDAFLTPSEAGAADADVTPYVLNDGNDVEIGLTTIGGSVTTGTRTVVVSKIGGIVGTTKLTLTGAATMRFIASAAEYNDFFRLSTVDTDGTLAANSDTKIASQKAVKTYADTGLALKLVKASNLSDVADLDTAFTNLANGAGGFNAPFNLGLAVSAASSALTIALKGADGNDPSATNPVLIPFRNVTTTTGTPTWGVITAANSLVISSGSTLGVTSSTAFRLWVVMFNDGGTFRLGVINCSTATQIYPLSESRVASSTAEGGAGAADSAGVFYTGTAVTSKAYRILGYIEWSASGLTAGTWTTTNLLYVQLMGPGIHRPGATVQEVYVSSAPNDSTSSATFVTTSSTASITPVSAANLIRVSVYGATDNGASGRNAQAQLSRGNTANTNMIGSFATNFNAGARQIGPCALDALDKPNTISAQAYYVQFRNVLGGAVVWGNGDTSTFTLREIMG